MKANDIISFIIEEAQHHVINDDHLKNAESALAACMKKTEKSKEKKKEKNQSGEACGNCKRTNHTTENCYSKLSSLTGMITRVLLGRYKDDPLKSTPPTVHCRDHLGMVFCPY